MAGDLRNLLGQCIFAELNGGPKTQALTKGITNEDATIHMYEFPA
jgi:hypothetical protein